MVELIPKMRILKGSIRYPPHTTYYHEQNKEKRTGKIEDSGLLGCDTVFIDRSVMRQKT
jgi:hypothetical protein